MKDDSDTLIFNTDEECSNYIKACMGNKFFGHKDDRVSSYNRSADLLHGATSRLDL